MNARRPRPSSPRRSPTATAASPSLPRSQGSVAAHLTYWLENIAVHQLRENTHTRYAACVHRYLIPGLSKKKLTKLTAKDVRTWLNQLRTTCQCCTRGIDARRDQPRCCAAGQCCHKLLSPLTLTYIHSVLKSALEHAVREEEIPCNGARNVRTGTPRPRRFEPLTTDEARRFLTTAQDHRLHALFELALYTGLRKGELLGLRWEDLGLGSGTAAIRRTLQRTSAGRLTTLPTKTRASERRIALPARCVQSLKRHHEQQQREHEAADTAWQPNGHIFTTTQGRPIDPTNLTRTFNTLLRTACLRRIRFHDLRHSTATLLLEQGVELVVIKEHPRPRPHRRHRHRLCPRPAPPPARRHRHSRYRARRPGDHQDGQLRRRRTTTLHRPRPLTLPSTTAVTPRRSPARTHLTGLHLCVRDLPARTLQSYGLTPERISQRDHGRARNRRRRPPWPRKAEYC
jgi:integrase